MGTWQVRPRADDRWQVLTPGHTQACVRDGQAEATVVATQLAAAEGGGTLLVYTLDGDIDLQISVPA